MAKVHLTGISGGDTIYLKNVENRKDVLSKYEVFCKNHKDILDQFPQNPITYNEQENCIDFSPIIREIDSGGSHEDNPIARFLAYNDVTKSYPIKSEWLVDDRGLTPQDMWEMVPGWPSQYATPFPDAFYKDLYELFGSSFSIEFHIFGTSVDDMQATIYLEKDGLVWEMVEPEEYDEDEEFQFCEECGRELFEHEIEELYFKEAEKGLCSDCS
jgi:hypothetical protein